MNHTSHAMVGERGRKKNASEVLFLHCAPEKEIAHPKEEMHLRDIFLSLSFMKHCIQGVVQMLASSSIFNVHFKLNGSDVVGNIEL
jgi:hypothetical protein